MVLGAFLVTMVGYGAAYSFAAFAPVLEDRFALSRAAVNSIYAVSGCAAFMVSAVSGPLADRHGPRALATTGVLLVAASLALTAAARGFADLLLCYGLFAGVGIGLSYIPAVAAVQRWFIAWRGLASGLAASGIGAGALLAPLAAAALLDSSGWRAAFAIFAGATALLGLVGANLLAPSPEAFGQHPDGLLLAQPITFEESPAETFWNREFCLLYSACFLVSIPIALPFAHLVAYAEDHGTSRVEALALISLIGAGSIAGRFVLGAVADRLGRRQCLLGCCWGVAVATLGWAGSDTLPRLRIFALVFGVVYGGFVALLPAVTVDLFGRSLAGKAIGVLYTGRGMAVLVGAPAIASLGAFGISDSQLLVGCAVIGLVGSFMMKRVCLIRG